MLSSPRHRRSSGQSLAEFALVLPVLALLLFGIIQLGVTFGGYNALINSVREAARYGSVCVGPTSSCGPATASHLAAEIKKSGFGYAVSSTGHLSTGQVQYQAYQVPPGASDTTPSWNIRMQVTGCVNAALYIPFIGNILNPSNPGTLPLKSVEWFRVEGSPALSAPTDTADYPTEPAWGTSYPLPGGTCS